MSSNESTSPFLCTFPCFVVQLQGDGMVAITIDDARALAVLTDIDLAERFTKTVIQSSGKQAIPVELKGESDLLAQLLEAKRLGASIMALDPQVDVVSRRVSQQQLEIDAAIDTLKRSMGE